VTEGGKSNGSSVFGYVDQQDVISRIDATEDDDLSSCFFGDSIQDVENAATRIFDIGVGDAAQSDEPRMDGPFGPAAGEATLVEEPPTWLEPDSQPQGQQVPAQAPLADDTVERRAFILGGPSALHRT
jgi:hypothetical protein